MKKNYLFKMLAVSSLGLALVACDGKNEDVKTSIPEIANPSKPDAVTFETAYNTLVVSGIGLLSSNVGTPVTSVMSLKSITDQVVEETKETTSLETEVKTNNGLDKLSDDFKKEVLDNLAIAEGTLTGSGSMSEVTKSDKEEYEFMYTLTKTDLAGNSVVYTFYYNEITKDNSADSDDEDEKLINGIVICKDIEYKVSGKKEIESDEEEDQFKIMIDDNNYVIIGTEKEDTETEYNYARYENNKLVYESQVEYELDENGEVELSFETTDAEGNEMEYSYELVTINEQSVINVEIEKTNMKSEAVIKITTDENGEKTYEFVEYNEEENTPEADKEA